MALQATDEERRAVATWVVDNAATSRTSKRRSSGSGPSCEQPGRDEGQGNTRETLTIPVSSRRYHRRMPDFELVTDLAPAGDQPEAIAALVEGIERGDKFQTLLGITGSGKSFTIANVIAQAQRPTLVLAPNKILAAQLAAEFRELFPKNRVEYFVSYYDYYQPEAYLPTTDTYIEKDSSINDEIDRLRHSATSALLTRRDVIIVASVSAIYGLGSPEMYAKQLLMLERGRGARPAVDPAPARRAAVRAQRLRLHPQQVPRARRHDRDLPRVRGAGVAHLAVRRRGRAHLRASIRSPARSSRSSSRSRCSRRRTTSPTRSG